MNDWATLAASDPAKKEEYEVVFNKLLGTDIKWAKLNLEDLIQLAVLFDNPELFLKKLGVTDQLHQEEAKKRAGDVLMDLINTWDGPGVRALKKLLGTES